MLGTNSRESHVGLNMLHVRTHRTRCRAPEDILSRRRAVVRLSFSAVIDHGVTCHHAIGCTHWLRHLGASKGSAKYCVSCTTLPS